VGADAFPHDPVATRLSWERITDVLGFSTELLTDFVGRVPRGYQGRQEVLKMKREVVGHKIHKIRD